MTHVSDNSEVKSIIRRDIIDLYEQTNIDFLTFFKSVEEMHNNPDGYSVREILKKMLDVLDKLTHDREKIAMLRKLLSKL